MSVEYIILLAIAINGSRLWIKAAKHSSRNNYLLIKRLAELSFSPALLFIVFILILNAILNHYFA